MLSRTHRREPDSLAQVRRKHSRVSRVPRDGTATSSFEDTRLELSESLQVSAVNDGERLSSESPLLAFSMSFHDQSRTSIH